MLKLVIAIIGQADRSHIRQRRINRSPDALFHSLAFFLHIFGCRLIRLCNSFVHFLERGPLYSLFLFNDIFHQCDNILAATLTQNT
ncbi:hypothetical protein D3C75_1203250 [compost metagenome]